MTTVLPVLFKYCYKNCYNDSRELWAVMKGGGLALSNLIQPTISLEMPVPSKGHSGCWLILSVFILIKFWLSLCKIARISVILLLPLFSLMKYVLRTHIYNLIHRARF
jgi:hypothetical protein